MNTAKNTKFCGRIIYEIFELIGPPRPNKHGQSNTMPIYSNAMDRGAAAFGRGLPVVSIILEYMGMVLDCPCLALEAQ